RRVAMACREGLVESSLGVAPEARVRVAGGKREARSRRSRIVSHLRPGRGGRERRNDSAAPAGAGFLDDAIRWLRSFLACHRLPSCCPFGAKIRLARGQGDERQLPSG